MNPRTKIKVRKEDLLEAVKAQRDAALVAYEKELAAYDRKAAKAVERQRAFLQKALDSLADGKPATDAWAFRHNFPVGPSRLLKPTKFDRVISQLEMAVDETLSLSVEDYSAYLGGRG